MLFNKFRHEFVSKTVYDLLNTAKQKGMIKDNVNLKLFCDLYFKRFEEIALKNTNLIDKYSQKEILNHFVVYSLRGISSNDYTNKYY